MKKVMAVLPRPEHYNMVGDGFRVYNYFPSGYRIREKVSPFLMLDFGPEFDFGPSETPRGVDVHPHKGFETVTIAYKGSVEHYDSRGHHGIIQPGDVQWMTAGAGILHKEFHEKEFSKKGGPFEMVQLWVNLPARDKLTRPRYQSLESEQIPVVELPDAMGKIRVIAGRYEDTPGIAETFTEMNVWDVRLKAGASCPASIPASHHTLLLVVEGELRVNGQAVGVHSLVVFEQDGEDISLEAQKDSVVLVLSGIPINEPIAQYGPFVMNTTEELQVAFDEYHAGKFGELQ